MMNTVFEIAKRGLDFEPKEGWLFTPRWFVQSREGWVKALAKALRDGDEAFDRYYPDAYSGGRVGPVGEVNVLFRGPYVFAYEIDSAGDPLRVGYTHRVISGEPEFLRDRFGQRIGIFEVDCHDEGQEE